ncbi:MAG: hypothetical protein Pg6C_03810 [Treponemataceae bacterium]|nr:MAG: hypothetical protein Pg6C_03810 [Treponemataceae bacterium]
MKKLMATIFICVYKCKTRGLRAMARILTKLPDAHTGVLTLGGMCQVLK